MEESKNSKRLHGFTDVLKFDLNFSEKTYVCDLTLVLKHNNHSLNNVIYVIFIDVSCMNIKDFGGGLTQLLFLDVKYDNSFIDRKKYRVVDLENNQIEFFCNDFFILDQNP